MRKLNLNLKFFLPLTVVFLLIGMAHPFYLGVCEIKYEANEKTLQASVKLFTNDLEDALKKLNGKPIDLINVKDSAAVKKALHSYLQKRLQISVNGTLREYRFIGFEKEEEATWMYIELPNCPKPKSLNIHCSLLYDFLKEQMNILHVTVDGVNKSLKLNNPEKEAVFEF